MWPEGLLSERPAERLTALLSRRPRGLARADVPLLLGIPASAAAEAVTTQPIEVVGAGLVLSERIAEASAIALQAVTADHRTHPSGPGLSLGTLRQVVERFGPAGMAAVERLVARGELLNDQGHVRCADFRPAAGRSDAVLERLIALIEAGGLAPPSVADLETQTGERGVADALSLAARSGRVVRLEQDRYFGREALERFTATLIEVARLGPITPAGLREATGITRKYLIPLLEWADRSGLTIRRGDQRVPGPRLRSGSERDGTGAGAL
jgi:selenocysteine-specific elongation factor